MEAKELSLHIKANLKNTNDKFVSKRNLILQYYDLANNKWHTLINGLSSESGKLDTLIRLGLLEDENPTAYSVFNNSFIANALPAIRLIEGNTIDADWTSVYSFFPVIYITPENVLMLDFGDLWLLEDNQINRHIKGVHPDNEFAMAALPRPNGNHKLFPSLQAALMNAEILADYKPNEHTIQVVSKDAVNEDDKAQQIEELNHALNEMQLKLEKQIQVNTELTTKLTKLDEKESEGPIEIGEGGVKTPAPIVEPKSARDIYTTIVDEVKYASDKLENTPYTLDNISLNLKTHVVTDDEGFKLQLINAETADKANDQAISEVKIDIGTKTNSTNPNQSLLAPNIIGLTETVARQRLKAFGLRMKVIYQASKTKTIGQAFKQTPMPGNDIKKGDTIISIFAKNTEQFN